MRSSKFINQEILM